MNNMRGLVKDQQKDLGRRLVEKGTVGREADSDIILVLVDGIVQEFVWNLNCQLRNPEGNTNGNDLFEQRVGAM